MSKPLTNGALAAAIKAGLVLDGRLLYGDANRELRAEIQQTGARFKNGQWVLPDQQTYIEWAIKLGIRVDGQPPAVEPPPPPPPPPALDAEPPPMPALKREMQEAQAAVVADASPTNVLPPIETPDRQLLVLPPALLVGGAVSLDGDVTYEMLGEAREQTELGDVKLDETTKTTKQTVRDPVGYVAAKELRSEIYRDLRKIVQTTPLGWICRLDRKDELLAFMQDARRRIYEFNGAQRFHFLRFSLITARISSDDEIAAKEMAYEMQRILTDMRLALNSCDVKQIRANAGKLKELKPILNEVDQNVVQQAIDNARAEARKIVKDLGVKGDTIEAVQKRINTTAVDVARMRFAELAVPDEAPTLEAVFGRAALPIDLDDDSSNSSDAGAGNGGAEPSSGPSAEMKSSGLSKLPPMRSLS